MRTTQQEYGNRTMSKTIAATMIAGALLLGGASWAQADCKSDANKVAAKCLNGSIDPIDIKRCNAQSQKALEECEAINTVESQKTLHPQPGSQPIVPPGHPVPDLHKSPDFPKLDQ
jgi:hypothetical protein